MTDGIRLLTPLKDEDLEDLNIGDRVLLSGVVYSARDAAHRRMIEALENGEDLPFELRGQVIYYMGPSPEPSGRVIGSAGPTTASRMDIYTAVLLERGLKGAIGKGQRSPEVVRQFVEHKAVYFVAVGGTGALLADHITESRVIAYPDLGAEAVRQLMFKDFPVIVANDLGGNDIFLAGWKRYRRSAKRN